MTQSTTARYLILSHTSHKQTIRLHARSGAKREKGDNNVVDLPLDLDPGLAVVFQWPIFYCRDSIFVLAVLVSSSTNRYGGVDHPLFDSVLFPDRARACTAQTSHSTDIRIRLSHHPVRPPSYLPTVNSQSFSGSDPTRENSAYVQQNIPKRQRHGQVRKKHAGQYGTTCDAPHKNVVNPY